MKPLTQTKRATGVAKNDKAAKISTKPPRQKEAQCCAKTSRTAAGCHD
jgi:hypothetical protein